MCYKQRFIMRKSSDFCHKTPQIDNLMTYPCHLARHLTECNKLYVEIDNIFRVISLRLTTQLTEHGRENMGGARLCRK